MEPAPKFGSSAALLEGWERFVEVLESDPSHAVISTADAVDALLARSMIEKAISAGEPIEQARLEIADQRYRLLAPALMAHTRVPLYAQEEGAEQWWWHVPASGTASDIVDVATAAREKGVHPHTVRAAIRRRELPARTLGRTLLILRRDMEAWSPRTAGRPATSKVDSDGLLVAYLDAVTNNDATKARSLATALEQVAMTAARASAIAMGRLTEGRYDDVLEWVGRARGIGVKGKVAGALGMIRAIALQGLERGNEAIEEMNRVAEAVPDDPTVLGKFAEILWLNDRQERAEAIISNGLSRLSDPGELRLVRATLRFQADRAIEAYHDVLIFREQRPEHSWAMLLEGSILGRLGDLTNDAAAYSSAVSLFQKAIPTHGDTARVRLGIALGRLGRWTEAFDVAAELAGDQEQQSDVIRAALIGTLHSMDLNEAVRAARRSEETFGPTPLARAFLALHEVQQGRKDLALRLLSEDFRSDGFVRPEVAAVATAAWIGAGQPDSAVSLLRVSLKTTDDPPKLLLLQARAAMAAGRLDELAVALKDLAEGSDEVAWIAQIAAVLAGQIAKTGSSLEKHEPDQPKIRQLTERANLPTPWPQPPYDALDATTAISSRIH